MDNRKENLEKQRQALEDVKSENMEQYTETLFSIEPEELREVAAERTMFRYNGKLELMQKLREKYGEHFSRRQFDMIEKEVDERLPVREMPRERKSIHERLQEQEREPIQRKQTKRKHDLSL